MLPPEVGQLTALTELYLEDNQLAALPPEIGQLTALTELYLQGNHLKALPPEIGQLTALTELYLQGNHLTAVPPQIEQLTALTRLYLQGNHLKELPPEMGQLTALTRLDLSNNQLTALPPEIGQLTTLTELYLTGNQLTAVPPEIGQLTALTQLYLPCNQLTALPPEIGRLTSLGYLFLDGNKLTALPPEIGQLKDLTHLSLSSNQLFTLPPEIGMLTSLSHLFLHENESLGIDPAVLGPAMEDVFEENRKEPAAPRDILNYYFNLVGGGDRPLNEVKLLLLGRGGSGKTATVNRLLGRGFVPGTDETLGIDITDWRVGCPGGDPVLVHAWDFAGQTVAHGLHAFFMSHRSVYLLVLSGREQTAQEDAEYWLKLMEAYAGEETRYRSADGKLYANYVHREMPPVIVTLNKWESSETRPQVDRRALEEKFPFIAGWVETDCRTGHGFDNGKQRLPDILCDLIGQREWVRGKFPKVWHDAKEHFATMKDDYLAFTSFQELAIQKGVKAEEVRSFANALHRLGIALNFGDDERLKDTTVLNPHWVTRTIYKVLRQAPRESDAVMTLEHVAEVLPSEPTHMRAYAVELMRRFDLAFPLPERESHWLVPARLPETQPEGIAENFGERVEGATRLRFSVNPLPRMILPGFITRTHIHSDDLPHWRWANGVVLGLDGAQALVRADHAERTVSVTLTGKAEARPVLGALCRRELAVLFAEIPGLNPKEEMQVRPGVWQDVALMEELEREKQAKVPVLEGGRVQMVDVKRELDAITPPQTRDVEVWKPTVFISYSHKDERLKDELEMRMKVFQAAGLVGQVWTDRMLEAGELWDSRIKDEVTRADVVVLLLSNAALTSNYIRTIEMKTALDRHREGKAKVVPILLERCNWELFEELSSIQALPRDAKPVREWKPQNAGWYRVTEGLKAVLAGMGRRGRE
ncbi:MAG TPA: COR domain-containing protein, partial [Verrucomicrobiales bacterium]|nr:COR domain-containing protein [Verrucomicrobiales bacterium]